MAELVKTFVGFADVSAQAVFTASSGSDYILLDNADSRVTLLINNANAQKATVIMRAGDGSLSALGDVEIPVEGQRIVAVPFSRVESARVKRLTGDLKGRVNVDVTPEPGGTAGNVSIAVLSVE